MPICLVILGSGSNSKSIFELNNLFYVKIAVETFKKSGPSQCFACQCIDHGSAICTHPPRCVKCSSEHKAINCPKTIEQDPTCCNCGGNHTANYRGCPYLAQAIIAKPAPLSTANNVQTPLTQSNDTKHSQLDYASVTKPKTTVNYNRIINLLTDLLSAISATSNQF
jgi:hypothetical protein